MVAAAAAALAMLTGGGCQPVLRLSGRSPLRPVRMSPDSSVLEIFFVRFPYGEREANVTLWEELDEQQVAVEARQRLAMNGFRVGVAAGQVPPALVSLLELQGKPVPDGQAHELKPADLETASRVERSRWQLRAGSRKELLCSDVYDELPLLICEPQGGVWGESFAQARGVLAVESAPERDGRVRLRLVPEVQHGDYRTRFTGTQGMLRMEHAQLKRSFDDMTIGVTLSPGHMLVLGALTTRRGSLGHRFFTVHREGKIEQKLLVIRLAQTQHEDLFAPEEPLPLDLLAEVDEAQPAGRRREGR